MAASCAASQSRTTAAALSILIARLEVDIALFAPRIMQRCFDLIGDADRRDGTQPAIAKQLVKFRLLSQSQRTLQLHEKLARLPPDR